MASYGDVLKHLPAGDSFCRLQITFTNILWPDQTRQKLGSDLAPS